MNIFDESLQAHINARGKVEIKSKVPLINKHDLSIYYSPGVAAPSMKIYKKQSLVNQYTNHQNTVAVVSDGSAVLGLGNIGPYGALPVMEGKAILFKHFADIDAYPIVLNTQDPNEIISTVLNMAPSFGGINLEDFAAPNCFYIESELHKRLNIPVMHDDQHGTAIVVLAGLINAIKITHRRFNDLKIVLSGSGAAGVAITKIIHSYAPEANIIAVDSKGVISKDRKGLNPEKQMIAEISQTLGATNLKEAIIDADIFIGVSVANILNEDMIRSMKKNPIIFALANPEPEIKPELAKRAGAAVVATGRSDYPNQVNNVLAFPGVFRGALDKGVKIEEKHKLAAAESLSYCVSMPTADQIIPDPFDKNVVKAISAVF